MTKTNTVSFTRVYRIKKSFAVVHFEPGSEVESGSVASGKGHITFLPEGAELRVVGISRLHDCFEVMCESQLYSIFKEDLLGAWSIPMESVKPTLAMVAA